MRQTRERRTGRADGMEPPPRDCGRPFVPAYPANIENHSGRSARLREQQPLEEVEAGKVLRGVVKGSHPTQTPNRYCAIGANPVCSTSSFIPKRKTCDQCRRSVATKSWR